MFLSDFPECPIAPHQAARQFIERLDSGTCVLVAVSGGSDSTGLLISLHEALKASGRTDLFLTCATIDHGLRPEAADEARQVAALCVKHGIRHTIRRWDGEKPLTGISAASREARYRLLSEIASVTGAHVIATGHNIGDQVETAAMRAERSQSDNNIGLAGMADAVLYDRKIWVLRPFLYCTRQDIRSFLTERGQGWIDDPGNDNLKSERVRFRQRFINAGDVDMSSAARAGSRRYQLSTQAAKFLAGHVRIIHGASGCVDRAALDMNEDVLAHGLGVLASVMGGRSRVPASDSMDRVMAFIAANRPGRLTVGRVVFDLRQDALYIYRENRSIPTIEVAPGEGAIWDDRFRVVNGGHSIITVNGGWPSERPVMDNVPHGVITRIAPAAFPVAVSGAEALSTERLLPIFDHFLPAFDLEMANAVARLIGRDSFAKLPFANRTATY